MPVLIPQTLKLGFAQVFRYLRREWIATDLGAFAQEIPNIVQTLLFNEFTHHRLQGLRGISAEGILDEGTGILIYINFRVVGWRLIDSGLHNDALVH
jgi:hypothetical protein